MRSYIVKENHFGSVVCKFLRYKHTHTHTHTQTSYYYNDYLIASPAEFRKSASKVTAANRSPLCNEATLSANF